MCFKYCFIANKYPVLFGKNRVSKYKIHEKNVDFSGVTFPVTLNQIGAIEKKNETNINIFGFHYNEEKTILPLYISDNNYKNICDMLLIKKLQVDGTILSHYVLITDLSSFLSTQSKANRRLFYCRRCLQHYGFQNKLDEHVKVCNNLVRKK